ncbi:MAG TPA: NUDIX hydrolase [Candidatus Paceibacterota bacterium]
MKKIVYQGKIIEVVQEEVEANGKTKTFEFARRSPGTRLIIQKGDKVLITKEFRRELNAYDYRLPGGKVFDSLDEYNTALESGVDIALAAKQAAIKEGKEEVGVVAKDLSLFHRSVCGATVEWDLFYFVVKDFEETEQNLEGGEDISVEWIDKEEAKKMCLDGRISEERSALVLLRYLNN